MKMKIYKYMSLKDFGAWDEAINTKARILKEGKGEEFESLIEDFYPNGLSDTELNDILCLESDTIYKDLGIKDEKEVFEEKLGQLYTDICSRNYCSDCPIKDTVNYDCEESFRNMANDNDSFLHAIIQNDLDISLDDIEDMIENEIRRKYEDDENTCD